MRECAQFVLSLPIGTLVIGFLLGMAFMMALWWRLGREVAL